MRISESESVDAIVLDGEGMETGNARVAFDSGDDRGGPEPNSASASR